MTIIDRLKRVRNSAAPLKQALQSFGAAPMGRNGDDAFTITLDYPVHPTPRFGYELPPHGPLDAVISAGSSRYEDRLRALVGLREHLLAIPIDREDALTPFWHNGWFQGLDAVALYGFLAIERPSRFVEVGSGNSTKFARRAIADHGLQTHITSIDPQPRAEIDELCDTVIRQPLEHVDLSLFDELRAGDVCFLDGSHRAFMNSDATVFFTEVLPRLPAGVFVHVHDMFLPWDYPPQISDWYYSEHYLLACWLLAGDSLEVLLPNFYISTQPQLHHILDPVFDRFTWSATATNGTGFWLRTTTEPRASA